MRVLILLCGLVLPFVAHGQQVVKVHLQSSRGTVSHAVLWLEPLDHSSVAPVESPRSYTMVQQDKMFSPSMLVVPVGSIVSFPNKDPFFHNVFSLFNGQRFDLGLYQTGKTRNITFGRPGVSYIFCNIHPEMAAAIIALDTPHHALADQHGEVTLQHVPAGRYMLHVWAESASPQDLSALAREVYVGDGVTNLGAVNIPDSSGPREHHLNKFGQPYDPQLQNPYQ